MRGEGRGEGLVLLRKWPHPSSGLRPPSPLRRGREKARDVAFRINHGRRGPEQFPVDATAEGRIIAATHRGKTVAHPTTISHSPNLARAPGPARACPSPLPPPQILVGLLLRRAGFDRRPAEATRTPVGPSGITVRPDRATVRPSRMAVGPSQTPVGASHSTVGASRLPDGANPPFAGASQSFAGPDKPFAGVCQREVKTQQTSV